jgi:hypothetical protein
LAGTEPEEKLRAAEIYFFSRLIAPKQCKVKQAFANRTIPNFAAPFSTRFSTELLKTFTSH